MVCAEVVDVRVREWRNFLAISGGVTFLGGVVQGIRGEHFSAFACGALGATLLKGAWALDVVMDEQAKLASERMAIKCDKLRDLRGSEVDAVGPNAVPEGEEVVSVAVARDVRIAVNHLAFGKPRSVEGMADVLRVLDARWKEADTAAEAMLTMKYMAAATYWSVPDEEVRIMRFGTSGRVRKAVDSYNELRRAAPRVC
jgi:hypothetical protein